MNINSKEEILSINENRTIKTEGMSGELDRDFENNDQQPSKDFLGIFDKLDPTINGELIEKAWKQYDTVGQQVILEVLF